MRENVMGKRWRRLFGLTMVILLVPIGTGRLPAAHACSCFPGQPSVDEDLDRADVVLDAVALQRTVASDGGVFAYGDARFLGSAGGLPLAMPVIAMAATGSGSGYWLLGADGGVFAYGDAPFLGRPGRTGPTAASTPIVFPLLQVGITATHAGTGYWITDMVGHVTAYGPTAPLPAEIYGSLGNTVGIARTSTAQGVVIVDALGRSQVFGAASFGDLAAFQPLNAPVVAVSS